MFEKLFESTDTTNGPGWFMLGHSMYWTEKQNDSKTVELISHRAGKCFVLRCWQEWQGDIVPIRIPVWFGMCGETLVLYATTKVKLTDQSGSPLEGLYYVGKDSRICNRLLPQTLINWNA